jgi:chaperonin GroES
VPLSRRSPFNKPAPALCDPQAPTVNTTSSWHQHDRLLDSAEGGTYRRGIWHSGFETANSRAAHQTHKRRSMATPSFRPLHDRVLVKRIDAEAKTKGGIIIPDTVKEKPSEGRVIAVGPGGRDEAGKLIPIDIKVGDRVLFGKWSGTEIKIGGDDLLIMKESDILGVMG